MRYQSIGLFSFLCAGMLLSVFMFVGTARADSLVFKAELSGANENPPVATTSATTTGTARVWFEDVRTPRF